MGKKPSPATPKAQLKADITRFYKTANTVFDVSPDGKVLTLDRVKHYEDEP